MSEDKVGFIDTLKRAIYSIILFDLSANNYGATNFMRANQYVSNELLFLLHFELIYTQ